MRYRAIWIATLGAALLFLLAAAPISADAYTVKLHNGNEFVSAYHPIEADYDPEKYLIMTDVGNVIALPKEDVAEISHDLESQGFGRRIDTTTVDLGISANDMIVPDPDADVGMDGQIPANLQLQLQQMAVPGGGGGGFNAPLVAEPNSGGGLPVGMATSGYLPQQ